MKTCTLNVIFIGLLLFTKAPAQSSEIVTNKTIVSLVKADMDKTVITSKIETSTCKFDLSTDGLIALKKNGVPPDIIKTMLEKLSPHKPETQPNSPVQAQHQTVPVVAILNQIHYYNHKINAAQPLEKTKANLVMKAMGMGNYNWEVDGESATMRISSLDSCSFLVSMAEALGDPGAWFTLYKLNTKKNKRSAVWVKTISGKNNTKGVIDYTSKKIGNDMFEIMPSAKLEKGEYFFLAKGTMSTYAGRAADVFAFGVD